MKLIILFLLAANIVFAEEITITIGEWEPFISEKYENYGVVCEIINKSFELSEINVKYEFYPWKRSYKLVADGKKDASAIWGKTYERETECLFSRVIYTGESVLFYLEAKPVTWSGDITDLMGLEIGLSLGSAKSKVLKTAEHQGIVKYQIGGDKKAVFRKLMAKRFDAVDEVKSVGLQIINKYIDRKSRKKVAYTSPLEKWPYHLIFSRKRPKSNYYLKVFNQNYEELKRKKIVEGIWQKFYNDEYRK